jgi:hypothetical protein
MILSTDPKFLFIHIPKTAGTSVEESLYQYQDFKYHHLVHGCALQFKHYLKDDFFEELFKFTYLRNPWDLQVSCWRYFVRNHGVDMKFNEYIDWKFNGNIEDMKDRLPKDNPNVNITLLRNGFYIHRTPMTYFLIDEKGNFLVDYIGSMEKSQDHYGIITNKLGIEENSLPYINTSIKSEDSVNYKDYYNKKSIEIVRNRFALDILMYGYSFEDGFADPKKIGYITEENDSISKRGYKLPIDFYFPIGDIPYGLGDIEYRYKEEHFDEEFTKFQINKSQRRVYTLENNIRIIEEKITHFENEILDHPNDLIIFEKYSKDIEKLRAKLFLYKIEIRRIQFSIGDM